MVFIALPPSRFQAWKRRRRSYNRRRSEPLPITKLVTPWLAGIWNTLTPFSRSLSLKCTICCIIQADRQSAVGSFYSVVSWRVAGVHHTERQGPGLRAVPATRAVSLHQGAALRSHVHDPWRSRLRANLLWPHHVRRSRRPSEGHAICVHAGRIFVRAFTECSCVRRVSSLTVRV